MEFIETYDGSFTLYDEAFDEHYHSIKDGALNESLNKHIKAFDFLDKSTGDIYILDICFGLGYNTLATIYYLEEKITNQKVYIYSPEINLELITSLKNFTYPDELQKYKTLIDELSINHRANYKNFYIELYIGDAREFLKNINIEFDLIYQDAFSLQKNPTLWSFEYFNLLVSKMGRKSIITTYSIASNVRYSIYLNGLNIYEVRFAKKLSTIASNFQLPLKMVDMELKMQRNPNLEAIYDKNLKNSPKTLDK